MKDVLAVILGGGQGTRLFPLTRLRAKPAVPIGGKFRLIDIPISNCLHWGLKKIYILTQFNTTSLHRHIVNTYKFDGFSKGFLQVLAAQQTIDNTNWYQGTADAVRKNLEHIKNQDVDLVVVLSGDQLYRIDLNRITRAHRETGAEVTIATKPVDREATRGFGIMKVDEDLRIVDFNEKPKDQSLLDKFQLPGSVAGTGDTRAYLASMGIYVFNKSTLMELLEKNLDEDFGRQIIPQSIGTHRVFSYIFNGYWEDIGTIGSFFEANLDFAAPVPQFNFYDEEYPIYTRARFLPGSKISRCDVKHALICDGSMIAGCEISHSLVGIRSIIKDGARMERVVMMGADFYEAHGGAAPVPVGIGKDCFIRNAILDKNVRIGERVVIDPADSMNAPLPGGVHYKDGIVVVEKNAVIPDGTRIGRFS